MSVGEVCAGEWAVGSESFIGGREERGTLIATSGCRRSRLRRRLDGGDTRNGPHQTCETIGRLFTLRHRVNSIKVPNRVPVFTQAAHLPGGPRSLMARKGGSNKANR